MHNHSTRSGYTINITAAMYVALLPCYNVARDVKVVIEGLRATFGDAIVAVDDGSTDSTLKVLKQLPVHCIAHMPNQGKGHAIKTGIAYILEKFPHVEGVLLIDSDGQHDPGEAIHFIQTHKDTHADLIIGQRSFDNKMPWIRRITNGLTAYILSKKCGQPLFDPLNGYKLISRKFLTEFHATTHRYEIDFELLKHALDNNLNIAWVPVRTIYAPGHGHFKSLPLRDVWQQLLYFWKL